MSGIDILISKNPARHYGSNWQNWGFIYQILHAGCLCRKDISYSFKIEGISHISRRMIFWYVQWIEIQVFGSHFRWFIYSESHSLESIVDRV
ncbi:MAG: hypothetical protein ACD_2C00029G0001 [uncultured bacterium (gcode 4)]|uniref:Uncharacterized protein n=1 Tax=uncultured bacterium (gcode 4) TaxID=1234023 RepID=K2FGD7_9BACT|nr:MAG: hypothetical protein ACD_2C00029G0001 [uncultured bacterium (gcode 4)]